MQKNIIKKPTFKKTSTNKTYKLYEKELLKKNLHNQTKTSKRTTKTN